MGDTISSLVFRPPRPTPIHPSEYFYLDVDVHSPLCTNKSHPAPSGGGSCGGSARQGYDDAGGGGGGCLGAGCFDNGESDLASLDASYIGGDGGGCINPGFIGGGGDADEGPAGGGEGPVNNVRNGQAYKIPAFFIRRRNATQTILFSHGNAEDLGMMYGRMKDLAMVLGVNVMAYDYTGYGLSVPGPACGTGSAGNNAEDGSGDGSPSGVEGPSENMIYRNIEAAYRYLTVVRRIPPDQIVLYGRSLGSGPSCYLAAKTALNGRSVGGLILHSPFLSVYKVVADLNGLDMGIVGDLFHNEKRARSVRCPTLIIHGKEDEVVPFWHAPRLLAAVPPEFRAQPFYVEGMGHNHIESRCREEYIKVVVNFLRMGVWSNARGGPSSGGYAYARSRSSPVPSENDPPSSSSQPYRGPSPVPVHERASETKENVSTGFYVNRTWLRHARVLIREAFADAGCYIPMGAGGGSSGSGSAGGGTSRSGSRGRAASGGSSAAGSRGSGGSGSSRRQCNRSEALSDARDDEDEFAPWRAVAGVHRGRSLMARPASPTCEGSVASAASPPRAGGRQSSPYKQEKVLTARLDDGSNHPSAGGGGRHHPSEGGGSLRYYHKSQSMPVAPASAGARRDALSSSAAAAVGLRLSSGSAARGRPSATSARPASPRTRAREILRQQVSAQQAELRQRGYGGGRSSSMALRR